jgi:cation transport regulator ChaC
MAVIGSLVVNLLANTTGFSNGLKKGAGEAKAFESRMTAMRNTISGVAGALGVVGGTVAAGAFLKSAIAEAMEGQKEMAQLAAVIKSTGGAAGFSVQQIDDFANALQETTTFSDGATKSAASLLMTFTNISGSVFTDAIKSAQDMSTAMGSDLNTSIIQLGKALNDPIKGVSALSKVGVSFTDDQKKMIKGFVEANDVMSAQKMVLAELAKEFGGSAAAALDTTAGRLDKLKNKWDSLKEDFGTVATPALDAGIEGASKGIGWYQSYKDWWAGKGGNDLMNMTTSAGPNGTNNSYLQNLKKPTLASVFPMDETSEWEAKQEPLAKNVAKNFANALDLAFESQFVGNASRRDMFKNAKEWDGKRMKQFGAALNMGLGQLGGSTNLGVFNSMRDAKVGSTKPLAVTIKDRVLLADPGMRGSQSHLEAIIKQKGGKLDASFVDIQKQQLRTLQSIERNTGGAGVGVV